ncbi:hypothetical protein D3C76_938930 [compost metagenome]
MAQLGNTGEAHREAVNLRLRYPGREHAAQVSHREHTVGENIGLPGLAGEIEIDMNLVVVA